MQGDMVSSSGCQPFHWLTAFSFYPQVLYAKNLCTFDGNVNPSADGRKNKKINYYY